jgi:hypothetical protein
VASPLEGSLAKTIGKTFNNLFLSATLSREVAIDSPAPEPGEPAQTVTQTFSCKAITEEFSDYYKLQNLVQANERKILVLADSLNTEPKQNDKITIRNKTYTVVSVGTDPAKATWELRATS